MAPVFNAYTVPICLEGFDWRNLLSVQTADIQKTLTDYITANGGRLDGNWYRFSIQQGVTDTIAKTVALKGVVYDLPTH